MQARTKLKNVVQYLLQGSGPALVVASFGRSGSTLIYDALVEAAARHRFGSTNLIWQRLCRDQTWTLSDSRLYRGVIYKTHDYPDALAGRNGVKALFLFGSAVEAALSVYSCRERYGREWVDEHFRHLKSDNSFDDLLSMDALGFMDQARAWSTFDKVEMLCLRYEELWEEIETVRDFCGMDVNLPTQRARAAKTYPDEIMAAAERVYRPIDEIMAKLPDSFISGPHIHSLLDEA